MVAIAEISADDTIIFDIYTDHILDGDQILNDNLTQDEKEEMANIV